MVEKAAGARRADRVHAKVGDDTAPDDNNLAVLPADFDNGLDVGNMVEGGHRLAGNLVLDQVGADQGPRQGAGAASGRHTRHHRAGRQSLPDFPQAPLHRRHRHAPGRQVAAGYQTAVGIQRGELGGHRADVNSQIDFHKTLLFFNHLPSPTASTFILSIYSHPAALAALSSTLSSPLNATPPHPFLFL